MATEKYLYLTTTGHVSGKPHEIEIWYVEHGGCYYLVSGKPDTSHWVRNIRARAAVDFRLGGITAAGSAAFPGDAELLEAVTAKMDEKYGWSKGLVVEICPRAAT